MEICNSDIYFRSFLDNQEERCQKQNYDIFDLSVLPEYETCPPEELFSPLFEEKSPSPILELVSNPEPTVQLPPPAATQPVLEKVEQKIRDKNVKRKSRRKRQKSDGLKYKKVDDNTFVPIIKKKPAGRPRNTEICVFCRFRHVQCTEDCITKKIYGTFTDEQMKKYGRLWKNLGCKIFYYDDGKRISSNKIENPEELEERIEQLLAENNNGDFSSSDETNE